MTNQHISRWKSLLGILLAAGCVLSARAQSAAVTVKTIGGGPAPDVLHGPSNGYRDGTGVQNSQFNFPAGLALDGAGNLLIADRDNNKLRKIFLTQDRAVTVITNLSKPVAVAVDGAANTYILNQGTNSSTGSLVKYNSFGFLVNTWTGLELPTAVALDASTNLYVTELNGKLKRIKQDGSAPQVLLTTLGQPRGLAVLDSGLVAVSESASNRISILNPISLATVRTIGTGVAGFRDGPGALALFNKPWQIARSPNGALVVADRGNHRVRMVGTDNVVVTLFGMDTNSWASDFPGWEDGSNEFAESREPAGIAVGSDGVVYDTETYYHLIRKATGAPLSGGTGGSGGGTGGGSLVSTPTFGPFTGYFPMGTLITITNLNTNAFFNNRVYYTTDGTEPTTNSLDVPFNGGNVGVIQWRETTRDLTSLRLKAFSGANASTVLSGQTVATNEVGIPRDVPAGIGATLVLPVVANLVQGDTLRSLQFLVEVAPVGTAKPLQFGIKALPMGANDFIPVVAAATNLPSTVAQIGADGVARLAVSYIGTNANFQVKNFGVVVMLSIPIPANAAAEDRYSIRLTGVSATSDGLNGFVRLNTQPARQIIVKTNLSYLVGDSAPTGWYNAEYAGSVGTFGDNALDNRDVNNAFYASLGVRVPYEGSDAFDAMDVFPEDIGGIAGGDLKIRFLDWQVILQRSLGLKTNSFRRMWAPGGFRVANMAPTPALGDAPGTSFDSSTNGGWSRAALLGALPVANAQPGMVASVPVYLKTKPGVSIAGMAFRATIETPAGAAPVTSGLQFTPAVGISNPVQSAGLSANVMLVGWPMLGGSGAFTPSLQGSNLIGYVNFTIPGNAVDRVVYRLNFAFASGSPDFTTEYDFEVISSGIGVRTSAFQVNDGTPDDWKIHYFGSVDNPVAQATADPDGDGVTNYQEYLSNSNPADFLLRSSVVSPGVVKLTWYGANGKSYVLESSGTRTAGSWTAVTNAAGQGAVIDYVDGNTQNGSRFYRLRLTE